MLGYRLIKEIYIFFKVDVVSMKFWTRLVSKSELSSDTWDAIQYLYDK